MKTSRRYAFVYLILLLEARCGETHSATQFEDAPNANYLPSGTVSFESSVPTDHAKNVPLTQPLKLKFTGAIRSESLQDYVSLFVSDETGRAISGDFSVNSTRDEISWTPRFNGRQVSLEPSTHYKVVAQFIEDQGGQVIAPWFFDFQTVPFATSTGRFKVIYLGKEQTSTTSSAQNGGSTILGTKTPIDVQFSEEIYPGTSTCSKTIWANVFQIEGVSFGGLSGTSGEACVVCRSTPGGNRCDTLRFTPTTTWPGAVISVRVRPSLGLKGLSGEPLNKEERATFYVF